MDNTMLWRPSENIETNMNYFREIINQKYHLQLEKYDDLHKWSVTEYSHFWEEVWKFTEIKHSQDYTHVVDEKQAMNEIPKWFTDARLNYAENILRDRSDRIALYCCRESAGCVETKTFSELYDRVSSFASSLKKLGIEKGDVVAGFMPNCSETIEAMLATAAIGAIWTCASTDFGVKGVLDRFSQVRPKVLFSCDFVVYNGKEYSQIEKLEQIIPLLEDLKAVVVINYKQTNNNVNFTCIPKSIHIKEFLKMGEFNANIIKPTLEFVQVPFNHPLVIMYSSGTTGTPKCMVHSVGGTLIKHLEEHLIQGNVKPDDIMMYFTATGWMMWNWLISTLAIGTSIVLYDGSSLIPDLDTVWSLISDLKVTILGTGAKWLSIMESRQFEPKKTHNLDFLHTILSTGSPLSPQSFDYVYKNVKSDILLASITGGTDIIGCFAGINTTIPVYKGEIQSCHLGMAVESWNEERKPIFDQSGELVCVKPFPSMPVYFWNDKDGSKYQNAYFNKYSGVWCHGDFCRINSKTGGIVMLGRSDGTLNPNGVRFGSAEIYNIVGQLKEIQDSLCVAQINCHGDERVVLFLKMSSGCDFNQELVDRIRYIIRNGLSPRHVPAIILETRDIPYTINGKKVEVAVKLIISGRDVNERTALSNPSSLDLFYNLKELKNW